jgi:hypothetical protein
MKNNPYVVKKYARMDKLKRLSVSTGILSRTASDANSFSDADKEKWQRLLQDCSEPAYSVKYLDELGEEITGTIVGGLKKSYNAISSLTGKVINPEDSYMNKTAKISKVKAYYNITKKSGVEKIVSKPGFFGKSLMGLNIISDIIILGKNLYEAWENGKQVLNELPLEKWGIEASYVMIPTPPTIQKTGSDLKKLINQNKNSPEALAELLDIAKVLKAYSSDFISSITNAILFFLDIADLAVALGTAMILKPLSGLANLLLALPIIAYEIANDTICDENFGGAIELIKKICESNLGQDNEQENNGIITLEDLGLAAGRSAIKVTQSIAN